MSDWTNDASKRARLHLGSAICFALAAVVFPLAGHEGRARDGFRIVVGCLFAVAALLQLLAYRKAARAGAR